MCSPLYSVARSWDDLNDKRFGKTWVLNARVSPGFSDYTLWRAFVKLKWDEIKRLPDELPRFLGRVEGRLRMARGAVCARAHQAGMGESGCL